MICASRLSQGGVIQYTIDSDLGLTDEWLCQYVCPRITCCFGREVGAILAKPLLWACFNVQYQERVQPDIRHRIISACIRRDLETDVSDFNPVRRHDVVASECKDCIFISSKKIVAFASEKNVAFASDDCVGRNSYLRRKNSYLRPLKISNERTNEQFQVMVQ